ncbi:MAG: 4-hydroxythreonine-4-phosphate dehydrogenase PdxA [Pseudomonadota bacterium]|jgi:4-hydroxythreonine-4-phosphate dehydrogenase|nr:4-hydroxythreonine-4-phosphate dehydrogenase PdxA [Pseudomonadota bacterium]
MRLGITMGDASGVGPEILLRAYQNGELSSDVFAYGDAAILKAGADILSLDVALNVIDQPSALAPGFLNVIDLGHLAATDLVPGKVDLKAGAAARAYVLRATTDALAGKIDAMITLPMNKEATRLSDPNFCGHTELIADACGTDNFTLMLATPQVVCTHVSTHVSMEESIARCKTERVLNVITLTHDTLCRFIAEPRIAVCGLNPHAGENGLFGMQDLEQIKPAVERARANGIDAEGPLPGDTAFYLAVHQDRYDGVVCQYHDQGHGPMKLLAFESGVNVTAGLPIIRTSVDHGTAYDIAWQGKAFTAGLIHAIDYARKLAED